MASFISAESKSDYKAGDLTEEVFQSTEQGRAASQVIDTLEPASGSGDISSSLPDTELPDTGPWQRVFDTLLGLCESVQTVMTRLWGFVSSIFYNGMNPRGASCGIALRGSSIENLKIKIINEDETPRTDQEELEQKTAAEVAALKVEVRLQAKINKMESLLQEGELLASKLIEAVAQAAKVEAAKVEAAKEEAAKVEAAKEEAAKGAAAATDIVGDLVEGILGPLMDLMQKSGATSVEYLRTFGKILDAAATIELSETDKECILEDLSDEIDDVIELSETDQALIADDLLSRKIDAYCCSAYNRLPDPIKKELRAVLADQGFMIERIGSPSNINWQDLQITRAINQVLDSCLSCQLSKLQLLFCEAQTDFKKVEILLDIMQIEVVEFELDVIREKIHSAIGDLFKGLTKALQDQLKGEIWAAVLDPNNTTTDITILENKEVLRVEFSDLQETLETSDPDFGKKILKLDPCGELARKGLERWITNRDISSI